MSRVEVSRRVRFEAAHYLPAHAGACQRIHGHSWSAEVVVAGEIEQTPWQPEAGMVMDMGRIAEHFTSELEPLLDHQMLNQTLPRAYQPPSTENVARFLLDSYRDAGFPVVRVTVRETENQTATVTA